MTTPAPRRLPRSMLVAEHASGEVAQCDVAYSGVADYAVGVHGIAIGGNESAHTRGEAFVEAEALERHAPCLRRTEA